MLVLCEGDESLLLLKLWCCGWGFVVFEWCKLLLLILVFVECVFCCCLGVVVLWVELVIFVECKVWWFFIVIGGVL